MYICILLVCLHCTVHIHLQTALTLELHLGNMMCMHSTPLHNTADCTQADPQLILLQGGAWSHTMQTQRKGIQAPDPKQV